MLLFHCYCYLLFTVRTSSSELFVRLLCEINLIVSGVLMDKGDVLLRLLPNMKLIILIYMYVVRSECGDSSTGQFKYME